MTDDNLARTIAALRRFVKRGITAKLPVSDADLLALCDAAERNALREDAERYRWLRSKRLGQRIAYAIRGQDEGRDLYDDEADAAIDAHLKGKP